jgi:hypothetical protein
VGHPPTPPHSFLAGASLYADLRSAAAQARHGARPESCRARRLALRYRETPRPNVHYEWLCRYGAGIKAALDEKSLAMLRDVTTRELMRQVEFFH